MCHSLLACWIVQMECFAGRGALGQSDARCVDRVQVAGDVPWKLASYISWWWRGKGQLKCVKQPRQRSPVKVTFLENG